MELLGCEVRHTESLKLANSRRGEALRSFYSAFTLETVLKTYFCRLSRLGSSLFSGYPNRVKRYFAVAPTYLSTPTQPMGVWDVPIASDEQYHGCYVTVHVSLEGGGVNT